MFYDVNIACYHGDSSYGLNIKTKAYFFIHVIEFKYSEYGDHPLKKT